MKRFPEVLFILTGFLCVLYVAVQYFDFRLFEGPYMASKPLPPLPNALQSYPHLRPVPDTATNSTRPHSPAKAEKNPTASADNFTKDDLDARTSDAFERGRQAALAEVETRKQQDSLKTYVMIGITVILLLCGVAVIMMERYDANQKHWSYATLGTIVGFWLR